MNNRAWHSQGSNFQDSRKHFSQHISYSVTFISSFLKSERKFSKSCRQSTASPVVRKHVRSRQNIEHDREQVSRPHFICKWRWFTLVLFFTYPTGSQTYLGHNTPTALVPTQLGTTTLDFTKYYKMVVSKSREHF